MAAYASALLRRFFKITFKTQDIESFLEAFFKKILKLKLILNFPI